MPFYLTKTPIIIQRIFKNYTWRFSTSNKVIYLTFDDGPTPEITEWTLNTLKEFNAKATFFCIGKNSKKYPEIIEKINAEGHTIGNHTYNHLNGWKTDVDVYLEDVESVPLAVGDVQCSVGGWQCSVGSVQLRSENFLKKEVVQQPQTTNNKLQTNNPKPQTPNNKQQTTNSKPQTQNPKPLFRPPYGKIKKNQAKKLIQKGYEIIMWDVLSADFDKKVTKEKCLENVLKNTQNGSIIVFHDSKKASEKMKYALPKVLAHFSKKGFIFESIKTSE